MVGAGLFLRTLINLRSANLGFNPERILLFDLNPPRSHYPAAKRVALYRQLEEKMSALPGVQSAIVSAEPLLANSGDISCFSPAGKPAGARDPDQTWTNSVGPDFFQTMSIPVIYGRAFTARDDRHAPKVAV